MVKAKKAVAETEEAEAEKTGTVVTKKKTSKKKDSKKGTKKNSKKKGKTTKKKGSKKKGAEKTTKRETEGLSKNQIKVLKALKGTKAGQKELTRVQLGKATGINGGWAKLLGAETRDGLGIHGSKSLSGMGLIVITQYEGERLLKMAITSKGKTKLEQVDK